MKRFVLPCLLIVLLGILAAGCGKSRNKAYAGSVQQYAAALSAICAPAQKQITNLNASSSADFAKKGPQIRDIIHGALDKMDNLTPPDQLKDAANDFISKSREEEGKIDDLVDAAKNNDQAKIQQIGQDIGAIDRATDKDARAIGATGCISKT